MQKDELSIRYDKLVKLTDLEREISKKKRELLFLQHKRAVEILDTDLMDKVREELHELLDKELQIETSYNMTLKLIKEEYINLIG